MTSILLIVCKTACVQRITQTLALMVFSAKSCAVTLLVSWLAGAPLFAKGAPKGRYLVLLKTPRAALTPCFVLHQFLGDLGSASFSNVCQHLVEVYLPVIISCHVLWNRFPTFLSIVRFLQKQHHELKAATKLFLGFRQLHCSVWLYNGCLTSVACLHRSFSADYFPPNFGR